jgi:hypothetical protein
LIPSLALAALLVRLAVGTNYWLHPFHAGAASVSCQLYRRPFRRICRCVKAFTDPVFVHTLARLLRQLGGGHIPRY